MSADRHTSVTSAGAMRSTRNATNTLSAAVRTALPVTRNPLTPKKTGTSETSNGRRVEIALKAESVADFYKQSRK